MKVLEVENEEFEKIMQSYVIEESKKNKDVKNNKKDINQLKQ